MNVSHELLRIGFAAAAFLSHSDKSVVQQGQTCPDGTVPLTNPTVDPGLLACWDGKTRELRVVGPDGQPVEVAIAEAYCPTPSCLDEIASENAATPGLVVLLDGDEVTIKGRSGAKIAISPEGNDGAITVFADESFYRAPLRPHEESPRSPIRPLAWYELLGLGGVGLLGAWEIIQQKLRQKAARPGWIVRPPTEDFFRDRYKQLRREAFVDLARELRTQLASPVNQAPSRALALTDQELIGQWLKNNPEKQILSKAERDRLENNAFLRGLKANAGALNQAFETGREVGNREGFQRGAVAAATAIKQKFDERAAHRGIAPPDDNVVEGTFTETL